MVDGRLMANILVMTIQMNLWRNMGLPLNHVLAAIFFHNGLLGGCTLFFTAGLFWIRYFSIAVVNDTIITTITKVFFAKPFKEGICHYFLTPNFFVRYFGNQRTDLAQWVYAHTKKVISISIYIWRYSCTNYILMACTGC